MREGFLLDPDVAYFNHGSYGACPVEVFADYQRWQFELERRPTEFLARRFDEVMHEARGVLAEFVGARVDDLVFSPNATSALNAVIRSLRIRPEEEILTTKHEYGAILRTLGFIRANVVLVEPAELIAKSGSERGRSSSPTSHRRRRSSSRSRRSATRRGRRAFCLSSTAHTCPATFRSTSRRSAPTCMRATATSGCARRRARGSCGHSPSIRTGSSRS